MKCRNNVNGECRNRHIGQFLFKCKMPCQHIDPMTYAEYIRSMSDEELTAAIYQLIYAKDPAAWFCKGSKECGELMDNDQDIPDEMCRECLLKKLRQTAEVD